jgi:benzoyl-CoA reductase/2-hydroxyglutaryl-CoA dehydratase subunit BcrC/BadD/HgdB
MVNLITWDEMDPQKPFQSLAKKLLANQSIGPYERMTRWISTMIKEYSIDGIIWMAPGGCRHFNSLSQMVKEDLRKEGNIPFYVLDLECVDERNYSKEQVRTRLDAFLEVLEDGSEE